MMFGDEVNKGVRPLEDGDDGYRPLARDVDLGPYSTTELLTLRNRIDSLLPPMEMKSMNLEEEVVRQFMTVKALQADTLSGHDESNKKAAVVNACAAALQTLAKMQVELHNAERFKKIENLLIRHLKLLPKESADIFMGQYSQLLLDKPGVEKK